MVVIGTLYDVIFVQMASNESDDQSNIEARNQNKKSKYTTNGNGHQPPPYQANISNSFSNAGYVISDSDVKDKMTCETNMNDMKVDTVQIDVNTAGEESQSPKLIEKQRGRSQLN